MAGLSITFERHGRAKFSPHDSQPAGPGMDKIHSPKKYLLEASFNRFPSPNGMFSMD